MFRYRQTPSAKLELENRQTLSFLSSSNPHFSLPWSHYVRLLKVETPEARQFYETEALRGGWSVRQLDRQISTLFYERTLASRNKGAMLKKGAIPQDGELLTPEEEIKDPLVLEFLGLKDEYSESDLEEALIEQLETFLLELGGDFAFVGRQKRLRIDDEWYRIDLLFFHRALRCLVVIDLKVGKFTHADAGQSCCCIWATLPSTGHALAKIRPLVSCCVLSTTMPSHITRSIAFPTKFLQQNIA